MTGASGGGSGPSGLLQHWIRKSVVRAKSLIIFTVEVWFSRTTDEQIKRMQMFGNRPDWTLLRVHHPSLSLLSTMGPQGEVVDIDFSLGSIYPHNNIPIQIHSRAFVPWLPLLEFCSLAYSSNSTLALCTVSGSSMESGTSNFLSRVLMTSFSTKYHSAIYIWLYMYVVDFCCWVPVVGCWNLLTHEAQPATADMDLHGPKRLAFQSALPRTCDWWWMVT